MNNAPISTARDGHDAPVVLGRGAVRQEVIVRELRSQIVRGQFEPGHRLPSRVEIEQQFGASTMTVQRALETLKRDGFVVANRGNGTFVSQYPPHLSRYAIVFPSAPDRPDWSRFWMAFSQEATELQNGSTLQLPLYYGVDEHHDSADYHRLVEDVRSHRLAGLIFASPTHQLRDTPLLDEPNLARVEFASNSSSGLSRVMTDSWSLVERALDFFQAQKRQRVAFVMAPRAAESDDQLLQAAQNCGLQTHARFCHRVHRSSPTTARALAHLMFHPSQTQRPDALLIGDDNLVEQTTLGLADAHAQGEISILAHCNFPHPPRAAVPVKWLGFDARRVLAACLQSIDAQRERVPLPRFSLIEAQFEDELTDFGRPNLAIANGRG